MADPTDPDTWWQSLDPERRRVWVKLVAGMTMTEIIAEAYRRATAETERAKPPQPGTTWRHAAGRIYTVLHIANEPDVPRYPLTVVYQSADGKVWARRADDWHRSMTEHDPGEATDG